MVPACVKTVPRILTIVVVVLGLIPAAGAFSVRAGAGELVGVDGTTYESPTWGYTLEWDEDDWEASRATSNDDVDVLL